MAPDKHEEPCIHRNINRVMEPPGSRENTVITQFVDECTSSPSVLD